MEYGITNLVETLEGSAERIKELEGWTNYRLANVVRDEMWALEDIYSPSADLLEVVIKRLMSAQHRVQRTAVAAFIVGGFVFLGIRWLVFGG